MQHLEVVSDNRYVNENVAGIDNYSMAGVAEPVSYKELVSGNNASDGFNNILVVFITDDTEDDKSEIIGTSRLPYGTDLSSITYPENADIEAEEYVRWPAFSDGEKLQHPMAIKGEITAIQKTLKSAETYPNTKYSLAIVSGNFSRDDSVTASVSSSDEKSLEYTVSVDGEKAGDVLSLRLYNPFEKYELYGIDENGSETLIKSEKKGSYAEYKGGLDYDKFIIKDTRFLTKIKSFFGK